MERGGIPAVSKGDTWKGVRLIRCWCGVVVRGIEG